MVLTFSERRIMVIPQDVAELWWGPSQPEPDPPPRNPARRVRVEGGTTLLHPGDLAES